MDLRAAILKEHSKRQTLFIAKQIIDNELKFNELIQLLLKNELNISNRAAWVLSTCFEANPQLIDSHIHDLIDFLKVPNLHDGIKRNLLKILEQVPIPESKEAFIIDTCFNYLLTDETIAVKVYAMSIVANLLQKYPELGNELRVVIEDQLPYGSPGFKSRASKVLKRISALS